jgi:hypothetical protein
MCIIFLCFQAMSYTNWVWKIYWPDIYRELRVICSRISIISIYH